MKAWLIDGYLGIDTLHLADLPDPVPGENEVLIDVRYAALNPADRYLAEGQYPARPPMPHILGRDGMGVVAALGSGVAKWKVGQAVSILRGEVGVERGGTFAERAVVPVESLVPAPEGWSEPQAASAALVYLTAYHALTDWGELPPSVVLITGASGGVGVAAIHLGVAMGHTMLGLSRDPEKSRRLVELGAKAIFNPKDTRWRRHLKETMGAARPVNLAIDTIGGPLLPEVIDTLAHMGRVSVVGRLAGPVPQFNTASLFFRRLRLGGVVVSGYTNAETRAAWDEVLKLLNKTGARPVIDEIFAFDQLPKAFEHLRKGPLGKVVLQVSRGG